MLSTDKNILIGGSESQQRMIDYGSLVEELHIVVKVSGFKFQDLRLGNVFVYPTHSRFKSLYLFDAYRIAKRIISKLPTANCQLLTTCQDPFETGLIGYWLKRRFGLPLQIQVHTDFLSPYFWRESIGNKVRVILGRRLVKRADGLRVVSERIKESILQTTNYKLQTNISVLPVFVDVEAIKNAPIKIDLHKKYPGRFIILMASRLTREKNIGLAIRAMKEIIKDYPEILLLIVGDGPVKRNLRLTTHNLQLENNVKFEDAVPFETLISNYKTADLFLLTSNYEGYGRTAVEATAAGLPVIMTDVGVAIGLVAPVGDKKTLIEKLELLVASKEKRNKVLESQKAVLEFYDSKNDYLSKIKESWQNCFSLLKK